MEDRIVNTQNESQHEEHSSNCFSDDRNCSDTSEFKKKRLVRRENPQHMLTLKVKQLQQNRKCIEDSLLRSIHVLGGMIPKHMATLDEKYLRHCLELIHISASKTSPCNTSVTYGSGNMGIFSDGLHPDIYRNENASDLTRFVFECPLATGTASVVVNPTGQWIIGSVMGSKSMINLLKSPFLQQLGAFDDADLERRSLNDLKDSASYNFVGTPDSLSNYSMHKLDKDLPNLYKHKYESKTLHNRLPSTSSTNSTSSDYSSAASVSIIQGMLQCTGKAGILHFVFSLDDQKEVYMADLCKVDSADDKSLDYMYFFYSTTGDQKEHDIHNKESRLIGKMRVSTSFTLCPNNLRLLETEFVLFAITENLGGEMQASSHRLRKNKGLSKKVVEVFRPRHSSKQRSLSRFGGSSTILENSLWESHHDADSNFDSSGGINIPENSFPPNLELSVIVVKDHLPDNSREKVGGWGLKFLKKVGIRQTTDTNESLVSATCARDSGDCSMSMTVVIPSGLHGGPRTRNGGPSGLLERWRSGGQCDCGGWDLGCTLRVLKAKPRKAEIVPHADTQGECKLVDLFLQGSEDDSPTLRMVNVHDGLYFIHFQSTVSALQSFSVAVAFIHTQSPTLRPKTVQDL
ncbi:hypothetical protein HS088_TW01G00326 [Tripterygium wilfordii]|uniref:Uncharacterized protein n=1 Tax=Tripterygium wilfordii TaxID=458696 RepID=A0A7J7E1F2_TRIWF|nr:uncharacterized protein LOC119998645 [Tripterygium wilfordii]XP_038701918.1 uncharacterized protein LOC119998645 [Tripterygium wilfordii]XP_038701923.1 uncharacterized protein LOC119998645 [Tripterygium wilfordii]KAF5752417.1 hypothetical protein HS088_TW01G00326 [Tripterygium wilfordii]